MNYIYDEYNSLIDSAPYWIKIIKEYDIAKVDTTKIVFPNGKIALKFARLKLDSVYGNKEMDSEEPFEITLIDNRLWYITGSLPEGWLGGVGEIIFPKYEKKVIYLTHGK